jgi:hypothetical protein
VEVYFSHLGLSVYPWCCSVCFIRFVQMLSGVCVWLQKLKERKKDGGDQPSVLVRQGVSRAASLS